MKQLVYFLLVISFFNAASGQNVAINTDGSIANSSAMLDIKSTSKGMLVPRMTTAQRTAIVSPATGLLVYDTNTNSFWFFDGAAWTNLVANSSSSGWSLSGNSGTDTTTNFIGTSDNQSLIFKVNNQRSGLLHPDGSLFWGRDAGLNSSGYGNIGLGTQALFNNNGRSNLIAIGDSALYNNGVGATSTFEAIGNVAIGSKSLYQNSSGSHNTALGFQSLKENTSGYGNIAIGSSALTFNTTGSSNTAMGLMALYGNATGSHNIGIGLVSLVSNHNGGQNIAVGNGALATNHDGNNNVSIGHNALYKNGNGSDNVAIGAGAMYYNQIGSRNTVVGNNAMAGSGVGNSNTAIGYDALRANGSGNFNSALGDSVLYNNSHGIYNTSSGYASSVNNFSGSRNSVYGALSFTANIEGNQNTAIGYQTMNANTIGSFNVALGNSALTGNKKGNYNTSIGYNADVSSDSLTNATSIGANATVNANNKVVIGNSSVTSIGGWANWSNFSDGRFKQNIREDVPGLAFIIKLRPVTYTLNVDGINEFNSKDFPKERKQTTLNADKKNIVYTGFMAQEVEQAAKSLNYNFSGIDKPKDDSKQTYALRYSDFVMPLVKAVQEQQKLIEQQQAAIEFLQKEINQLKTNKTN